jgi:hypothetical protein
MAGASAIGGGVVALLGGLLLGLLGFGEGDIATSFDLLSGQLLALGSVGGSDLGRGERPGPCAEAEAAWGGGGGRRWRRSLGGRGAAGVARLGLRKREKDRNPNS